MVVASAFSETVKVADVVVIFARLTAFPLVFEVHG